MLLNSHDERAKSTSHLNHVSWLNRLILAKSLCVWSLMSGQLTPEEALALVLQYLDEDPNLPPFLVSAVDKLKSLVIPGPMVDVFALSMVCSFKSFLYECVLHYFLEPYWTPSESCWTFYGVAHTHLFYCPGISRQMAVPS